MCDAFLDASHTGGWSVYLELVIWRFGVAPVLDLLGIVALGRPRTVRHVAALRHLLCARPPVKTHRPAIAARRNQRRMGGQHTSWVVRRLRVFDRSLAISGVPESSSCTSADGRPMCGDFANRGGLASASMVDVV